LRHIPKGRSVIIKPKTFLVFEENKNNNLKHREWHVFNTRRDFMGYIAWQPKWKKYAYYPDELMFEKEMYLCSMCLMELVKFLEKENGKK